MATAYCVYRVEHRDDGMTELSHVRIFWAQAEAVDYVSRLNSLNAKHGGSHSWTEAWVDRREPELSPGSLTPKDLELLEVARVHGALGTERPLTVWFSFIMNRAGGVAAYDELVIREWPKVDLDEEVEGDNCWHVSAHRRRIVLSDESIAGLRGEMEDLAERHGGTFDGWDVTGLGLRHAKPGKLPE